MILFTSALTDTKPRIVEKGVLYGIGRSGIPQSLLFVCPCGCNEHVSINLQTLYDPAWKLTIHEDHTVSVYPSIRRNTGCKSTLGIVHNQIAVNGK